MLSKNQERHLLQTYFNTKNSKNVPTHISQFGVPDGETDDATLFFITKYVDSIDRLVLRGSLVTADGLQLLKKLNRVFFLDLGELPLADTNINCILHLTMLEHLHIRHTEVSVNAAEMLLKNFPHLESFGVHLNEADMPRGEAWEKTYPNCEFILSRR